MQEIENKYKVYMVVNQITGKFYIGKTISTLTKRLNDHYTEAKRTTITERTYWQNTLLKYEKHNFKICQIFWAKSLEEMNNKEIEFIKILKAQNRDIGYNTAFGGNGGALPQYIMQQIADKKRSIKKENTTSRFYGVSSINSKRKIFKDIELTWGFWICHNGKSNGKGYYKTELEAAYYYNEYVKIHDLPHKLNIFTIEQQNEINNILLNKKHGYYFCTQNNKFKVRVTENKKTKCLGYFKEEKDARMAYNKYIINHKLDRQLNII